MAGRRTYEEMEQRIKELESEAIERGQTEDALRKSQEKFKVIFHESPDVIMIIDGKSRDILSVNQTCRHTLGYENEDLMGKHFSILFPPESEFSRADVLEKLHIYGRVFEEQEFIRADGSVCPMDLTATLIPWDEKRAILATLRDVSERKMLESQLQHAQKMEAIGTLAGGIAHDFNNILAAVIGYTEVAIMQLADDPKVKQDLEEVLKAGRRAGDLVKQIVAFSRSGKEERMAIQLNPVIKEAVKMLRASLPSTIEIRQDIEKDAGTVVADPTQIHHVLMNLCTNAHHAMEENGGILEVSLRNVESVKSETGIGPGPFLRLSVSDTGHGMAPEVLNRIFDPYFSTKEQGKGTGMGLSVSHGIIKSHRGTITVESEPGKGSIFHVYLPIIQERVEKQENDMVAPVQGEHECILFVDDERALAGMGKKMLEGLGYEVVSRTSSVEALELFRTRPDRFDLVITDMTMPNMTGDKLAKEIMDIRPDIPVILCTGYSERMSEEKAKGMGIKAFAMKPVVMKEIAGIIREVLDKASIEEDINEEKQGS